MGYVEHLLRGKLDYHRAIMHHHKNLGQHEDVASCLGVIAELEFVIEMLNDSEKYQNL